VLLIMAVLGSIYAAIATATEAAAIGVVGALVLARSRVAQPRDRSPNRCSARRGLYCMIALIPLRRAVPDAVDGLHRTAAHLAEWIGGIGPSQFWLIVALMIFYVILGCFLDGISMVVLTMGVILPTVEKAGIDLLWFGIFIVLVVEMAQITPPVGFNLFVPAGDDEKQLTWIAKVTLPMF
jgi:TRAP-type C4-dicarboxylate transport system permease large subunit